MPTLSQLNVKVTSPEEVDELRTVHKIIDHYRADHRGMTKFAALYELLLLADEVLSKKRNAKKEEREKREEKESHVAAELR